MQTIIKLILIIALLLCLFSFPYGFFQLVRFVAMVCFAMLAYKAFEEKKKTEVIIYLSLLILFQPISKIALGRILWNIIDVIVAVLLIASILLLDSRVSSKK